MKLGFIGLGRMGTRIVEKLLTAGHDVVVWNRTKGVTDQFQQLMTDKQLVSHLTTSDTIEILVNDLQAPRIIWSMLPAGSATQDTLDEVEKYLGPGDVIIDGGNANWKDTQTRYDHFTEKQIGFLGIGVSGGLLAFDNGYPLMVGGDKAAYDTITPILTSLMMPRGGHTYFGTGGVGHFIKMVHNGIEYGYMQSLGEGFGVLEKSPYPIDLVKTAELWQKGTIIQSFLIDRAKDALEKNQKLDDIEGVISESGEAQWTIDAGKEEKVPVEIIEKSLEFRRKSQKDENIQKSFAARMVAALRREFGGHTVEEKK